MRVLLVEDHPRLAVTVAGGLRRVGMAVDLAFDGEEALARAAVVDYDVVVLDRDLPGVDGDVVCRRLADGRECRVLMLTAAGTVLVRAIATAHDATIQIQPNAGGGLHVSVAFPRLPPENTTRTTGSDGVEVVAH